jgi:hypothetical protein
MTKTNVVNLRKNKYDVYIGRGSLFGNPFKIGRDGNRTDVIKKYHAYFYKKIETNKKFRKAVRELKNKTLGCYCKPFDCHGDLIVDFLLKEHLYP